MWNDFDKLTKIMFGFFAVMIVLAMFISSEDWVGPTFIVGAGLCYVFYRNARK